MRIIVNGQQAFGKTVLEALVDRGEDVAGVYCEPDKGERIDAIKEAALERGLPVFQPKSFRDPEVWEQMASLAPGGRSVPAATSRTSSGRCSSGTKRDCSSLPA